MAGAVSGGGSFMNSTTMANLAAQSGNTRTTAASSAPPPKKTHAHHATKGPKQQQVMEDDDGVTLSQGATQSSQATQSKRMQEMQENGEFAELAQRNGLGEMVEGEEADPSEESKLHEEARQAALHVPEGGQRIDTPNGESFVLNKEQVEHLQGFGDKHLPDEKYDQLFNGFSDEQVAAAENVFKNQAAGGVGKVANLKEAPAEIAVETAKPELQPVPTAGTMEIHDVGSAKSMNVPSQIQLDLPPETEQMAAEGQKKIDAAGKADAAAALQGRIDKAEDISNKAWDRVGNPATWQAAGMTKDDMVGIKERSEKQALEIVGGNPNHGLLGEAQYLAQSDQLAKWAADKAKTQLASKEKLELPQAKALQDMANGGHEYFVSRSEFLQLSMQQKEAQKADAPAAAPAAAAPNVAEAAAGAATVAGAATATGAWKVHNTTAPQTLEQRTKAAETASEAAWERVGNTENWKAAGITKDDLAGISERSTKQALEMVGGDANHPMHGEATYIAQADQLSQWAHKRVQENIASGNTGNLAEARALQHLATGGTDYVSSRHEFLQLSKEQEAAAAAGVGGAGAAKVAGAQAASEAKPVMSTAKAKELLETSQKALLQNHAHLTANVAHEYVAISLTQQRESLVKNQGYPPEYARAATSQFLGAYGRNLEADGHQRASNFIAQKAGEFSQDAKNEAKSKGIVLDDKQAMMLGHIRSQTVNLSGIAQTNQLHTLMGPESGIPSASSMMAKHTKNGEFDARGFSQEFGQMLQVKGPQIDKQINDLVAQAGQSKDPAQREALLTKAESLSLHYHNYADAYTCSSIIDNSKNSLIAAEVLSTNGKSDKPACLSALNNGAIAFQAAPAGASAQELEQSSNASWHAQQAVLQQHGGPILSREVVEKAQAGQQKHYEAMAGQDTSQGRVSQDEYSYLAQAAALATAATNQLALIEDKNSPEAKTLAASAQSGFAYVKDRESLLNARSANSLATNPGFQSSKAEWAQAQAQLNQLIG